MRGPPRPALLGSALTVPGCSLWPWMAQLSWPHGQQGSQAWQGSGLGIGSSHWRGAREGHRLYQAARRGPETQQNHKDAIHRL